ncbi:MAG: aminodeoxychorismate synthase component I [Imperialibacter sp.]|uniref:aminodeoxychorismate synthase component I n=1 Tax=Imperialibacter sp. TaxID=2038411 RepID=UPI0032F02B6C
MSLSTFIELLNKKGKDRVPFFFVVDFELQKPKVWDVDSLIGENILFNFEGFSNHQKKEAISVHAEKIYPAFETYEKAFNHVYQHLQAGNSFLVNLTAKTELITSASLPDIYHASSAKYKMFYKGEWVVFSPETFVRISGNTIETCPMKGTIDADLPGAAAKLLNDPKELAEHVTVVDLLRNDLSRVSNNVQVEKFRYIEELRTNSKHLLQTSSKITGRLPVGYEANLGEIIMELLPAGSISGAPKPMTCQVIREAEGEKRGYYTGVAGYFDGLSLNSCVLIRYIEMAGDQFFYRSGGGITAQSQAQQEYQELIDKVYVPTIGVYQNS